MSDRDVPCYDVTTKECKMCGETKKKADHFYRRVSNKDGFDYTCKDCYRTKRGARKAAIEKVHKPRGEILLERILEQLDAMKPIVFKLDHMESELSRLNAAIFKANAELVRLNAVADAKARGGVTEA